jgi:hypothetical protein
MYGFTSTTLCFGNSCLITSAFLSPQPDMSQVSDEGCGNVPPAQGCFIPQWAVTDEYGAMVEL